MTSLSLAQHGEVENLEENSEGLTLAMDCSTSSLTVALLRGTRIIAEQTSRADRNHSLHLLPFVQKLLDEQGLRAKDLTHVACGQGPGSYTGVRIAVTSAKTFAWSLGISMSAVSSLEAMAWGARERLKRNRHDAETPPTMEMGARAARWFIPLIDARRMQAFTGIYVDRGDLTESSSRLVLLGEDGIQKVQALTEKLLQMLDGQPSIDGSNADVRPVEIVFAGETEGFAQQIGTFRQAWPTGIVTELPHDIEAKDIGIVASLWGEAGVVSNPYGFVPNYAQLTEAEVNLQKKRSDHA